MVLLHLVTIVTTFLKDKIFSYLNLFIQIDGYT